MQKNYQKHYYRKDKVLYLLDQEKLLQNNHQHHSVQYNNLHVLQLTDNPRQVLTLLDLIIRD